ncbi:hypothetical protein FB45DRAFT_1127016 [Roridomyces roridus]|uniref:Uncharacterized protein n=1 Tax=Roridomyces roridus TaxID=1738132 RepID=A0AAD7F8X4_9AGAR|nr:hypothetical protein FB45DRAFT_1127016 [Roridomyces roridus]
MTIDRSFHARNISRLPWHLRAIHIAAMDGSTGDVVQLHRIVPNLTESELPGILPIIYVTPDSTLVPSPDVLDAIDITDEFSRPSSVDSAISAIFCLGGLTTNRRVSPNALVDLWPRPRAWMEFFLHFESDLVLSRSHTTTLHRGLSQSLMGFWSSPAMRYMVLSTAGFRLSLATAWPKLMQLSAGNVDKMLLALTGPMLAPSETKTGQHLAEVIEGCGGYCQIPAHCAGKPYILGDYNCR